MNRAVTIAGFVRQQAEQAPDSIAILAPDREPLSYSGLWEAITAHNLRLAELGISSGQRVALVLPNGPELAISFLAVASTATCAPLNPAYREQEFEFFLADLNASALILPEGEDSPAREAAKRLSMAVIDLAPDEADLAGSFTLLGDATGPIANPEFAQPSDIALVLHTSGTTSKPKLVALTHQNLCASAQHIVKTLTLRPDDRCLNIMPLFHIHGLMAALLASLAAGASIVCTPGFFAPRILDWTARMRPTWYSAVPTMHQAILDRARGRPDVMAETSLRFVRSSSSALPPQLMTELESVLGVPVIESYGMTEASHQMASNPLPPKVRKPGSVGPAAGPEIGIMNEVGDIVPSGEQGEVVIRGLNVMQGYDKNPEANQEAFVRDWFRTGDLGSLDSDKYLFITGRKKEMINRGGEKISPREIDEALLDHPAVSQAIAFAIPDQRTGEDVAAAVVLREGGTATERELRNFVAERLALFKVPRRIVLLDELPKGPTGKLQRIGLAEKLGLDRPEPDRQAKIVSPRSPTEEVLAELWREVLELEQVGVEHRFLDVGGDSMLATLLLSRLRARLKLEISIIDFFEAATISAQARLVEALLIEEIEGGSRERTEG
jgi:acyl-CoA synthetase (AMP-forming)/AMP-acid ligase II